MLGLVGEKRCFERGQLLVGLQPTEPFGGLQYAGGGQRSAMSALRHRFTLRAKTMIARTEERFDLKPEYLAADTAYGSAETLN